MHVPPLDTDVDMVLAECSDRLSELEARCAALAAENAALREYRPQPSGAGMMEALDAFYEYHEDVPEQGMMAAFEILCCKRPVIPATDAFLAEVRAQAHKEGAHFVANRMLAAWEAGFIDDTAKNAADIARMILTSTEFMADAPEGDFDRSFADGVLEDIAAQLRKGVQS
ncbi:TPA: Eae-like protein [Enterobacter roggenkampii]